MRHFTVPVLLLFLVSTLGIATASAQALAVWNVGQGILPDQFACAPYTLWNASASSPSLTSNELTFTNFGLNQYQFYSQAGADLAIPTTWIIEFEVKLLAGSSGHVARAPIGVAFSDHAGAWNTLYIGSGEAFLLSGNIVRGQTTALSTTDDFHTYRIEVTGNSISVEQDGNPILIGSMFTESGPGEARVGFGILSGFAQNTVAEFRSFQHNGSSLNCPVAIEDSTLGAIKARY